MKLRQNIAIIKPIVDSTSAVQEAKRRLQPVQQKL